MWDSIFSFTTPPTDNSPDSGDITWWWPHSEAITYCVKFPPWGLHTIGDGLTVRPSLGDVLTVGTSLSELPVGGVVNEKIESHITL